MKFILKLLLFIIIGLVALVVLFASIGENSRDSKNPPSINWSNYAPYKKIGIEESIKEKSCQGLQRAFNATDRTKTSQAKIDMFDYLDWHLNKFGCYK